MVVTSDEFFHIPQVPPDAVVIGGGAIGCEFASTLADLGSEGDDPRSPAQDPPAAATRT